LTTPVNGAANVFAPCLFQWTSAAAAQAYYLDVGTTPGAKDIVNSGTLLFSQTTCPAQSLPVSQTLYASIWTKLAGVWKPSYSTFTTGQQIAMLTSFASGASRVPTTGTIAWTSAPYAQNYRLQIGTTPSAGDVVDTGPIKNLSVGVSGLPGRQMLYASLSTEIGGQWYSSMSTFTTMPVTAILKTPADGTVSVLSPCVFQWTAVDAAQAYCLDVGTTPGAKDVINSGTLPVTGTTYAAKSLPRGQTLYASLWTKLAGVWWPSDGTFTTAP
jgi:hypothetical protein